MGLPDSPARTRDSAYEQADGADQGARCHVVAPARCFRRPWTVRLLRAQANLNTVFTVL